MGLLRGAGLLLVAASCAAAEETNESACRSLGFGPSLLCSSCGRLGEFVGEDDSLVGECKGCCVEDVSSSATVFPKAVLDIYR